MRRELRGQGCEHESDVLSAGVLPRRERMGVGGDVWSRRADGAVVVHQLIAETGDASHRRIDIGGGGYVRRGRRIVNRRCVRVISSIVLIVTIVGTIVTCIAIPLAALVPHGLDSTGRRIEREDLALVFVVQRAVRAALDSQRRGSRRLRVEGRTERPHRC